MGMIYEKNLQCLEQFHPILYEKLMAYEDIDTPHREKEVFAETAKNGERILGVVRDDMKTYLNSRYNPSAEADKFLGEDKDMPDYSVLMMFGLANGSFARAYVKGKKKDAKCLVYEPAVSVFLCVLHEVDLSDILPDMILIVKGLNDQELPRVLGYIIEAHNRKTNKHIILPKYAALFPNDLVEFKNVLKENYETVNVTINTSIEYGKRVCKNNFYNMRFFKNCSSGFDYIDRFPKELPAILVAAGPSLEKNIELIKKAKNKAFIIVVDTAIRKVFEHGIVPDMVVTMDFIKPLYLFDVKGLSEIPMLIDIDANHEILDYVKPEHVIFESSDVYLIDRMFEQTGSHIEAINKGGSVATATMANLIIWGFKTIIMVGQDLALTGNRVHAGEETTQIDMDDWRYSMIEGIDGSPVPTRKDFLMFIRWIEDIAYRYPEVTFVDATEGGAKKKYTKIMSLQDAIDTYCTKEYDITSIVEEIPRLFTGEHENLVEESLCQIKEDMIQLKKKMLEGVEICKQGEELLVNRQFENPKLAQLVTGLGEVDDYLLSQDVYMFLVKMIVKEDYGFADDMFIEEQDEIKEAIRMFAKSRTYYQAVADAIPQTIEFVDKALEDVTA